MKAKTIYVNLPVKDIKATRQFWTNLGVKINKQFSNDQAVALVLNDGAIYAMLISTEYFSTFTNRKIADSSTTQVILAIEVESMEKVDTIVMSAIANGASRFKEPVNMGWMYYDSFADIDGHQWEVLYIDSSKIPV